MGYEFTMGYLIAVNILMLGTFCIGYFTPTRSVLVSLDMMGEATFEFIFLIVLNVFNIWGITYISRRIRKPNVC